jgi:hypothetical protein
MNSQKFVISRFENNHPKQGYVFLCVFNTWWTYFDYGNFYRLVQYEGTITITCECVDLAPWRWSPWLQIFHLYRVVECHELEEGGHMSIFRLPSAQVDLVHKCCMLTNFTRLPNFSIA